jgi:hypothetical protein
MEITSATRTHHRCPDLEPDRATGVVEEVVLVRASRGWRARHRTTGAEHSRLPSEAAWEIQCIGDREGMSVYYAMRREEYHD